MRVLGADANNTDLVVALLPSHPEPLPRRFTPSGFDAVGLGDLREMLTRYLSTFRVETVVAVSDLSARTRPSDLKPRVQLETVLAVAAREAGCRFDESTLGSALQHLGLESGTGDKRRRLRTALEEALGAAELSPSPARRASAMGVALVSAGLDIGALS